MCGLLVGVFKYGKFDRAADVEVGQANLASQQAFLSLYLLLVSVSSLRFHSRDMISLSRRPLQNSNYDVVHS